jgi:arsenate reductase-like glutaredoxin family protein
MSRKVTLYLDPKDPYCAEIEKFLKECEVNLVVHDIRNNPLNASQLSQLLGNFDLEHFLNDNGKSSKAKRLDTSLANRKKTLELLAADNGLLRWPFVVSGRLMTVGYDRRLIRQMLQIKVEEKQ